MKAKFEDYKTKEQLLLGVDNLICRVLELASDAIMHEKNGHDGNIDRDDLINIFEDFAGKGYILNMKLDNGFEIDEDDREYLQGLINEKQAS